MVSGAHGEGQAHAPGEFEAGGRGGGDRGRPGAGGVPEPRLRRPVRRKGAADPPQQGGPCRRSHDPPVRGVLQGPGLFGRAHRLHRRRREEAGRGPHGAGRFRQGQAHGGEGGQKTVRVMVVGIPNVGKSTFINRIAGENRAKTG
ncbi:MAG: 50S ribosome-binding GTPase, partial [Clostridia bacterium]|nr:50S ribosome-binding GTPase [Clostridia bacterium]